MQKELIKKLAKELRLGSRICEVYEQIEAETHEEFLIKLLTEILEIRSVERKSRRIKQAGFDIYKDLSNFDFSKVTLPNALSKEELLNCNFVENKQNLIHYGQPGTGKTHLATALGMEACRKGFRVMYFKVSRLVNQLVREQSENNNKSFWDKLNKADVLILDELGYIPFERTGTQLLFQAVSACYEKKSVVITTNLPFEEWNSVFYDQKLTGALLDRLVHHGLLILHDGPSYRLTHSTMQ